MLTCILSLLLLVATHHCVLADRFSVVTPADGVKLLEWQPQRSRDCRSGTVRGGASRCTLLQRHAAAATEVLAEGRRHYKRSRIAIARNYFRAAAELKPTEPAAWVALANTHACELMAVCGHWSERDCDRLPPGSAAAALAGYSRGAQLDKRSTALKHQVNWLKKSLRRWLTPAALQRELTYAKGFLRVFSQDVVNGSTWVSSVHVDAGSGELVGPPKNWGHRGLVEDLPMEGGMKLLFGSPISHVSVVGAFGGLARFKERTAPIVTEVMRAYNEMKSRVGGNPDAFMLNNGFFQVQNKMQESPDGWAQLYSIPGFLELQATVRTGFNRYFAALGRNIESRDEDGFQWWFSVHYDSSVHPPHFHGNTMAAGVFYLQVPPGAGGLSFFDPRGGEAWKETGSTQQDEDASADGVRVPMPGSTHTPPFHRTYDLKPTTGDLVVFAPYLNHAVQGGDNDFSTPRISLSFNLAGHWQDTATLGAESVRGAAHQDTAASLPKDVDNTQCSAATQRQLVEQRRTIAALRQEVAELRAGTIAEDTPSTKPSESGDSAAAAPACLRINPHMLTATMHSDFSAIPAKPRVHAEMDSMLNNAKALNSEKEEQAKPNHAQAMMDDL